MENDPRLPVIVQVIDAIHRRLDEAADRDTFDDMRVDLLAIQQYIDRNLNLIDQHFPPEDYK